MKILYLNPIGRIGGAEQVLLSILAAFRQASPEVSLHLIAGAEGPLLQHAERLGAHTQLMAIPAGLAGLGDFQLRRTGNLEKLATVVRQPLVAGPAAWLYARRLRKVIRRIAPDVIHSNGIKTHLLSRLAGTGPIPVVWHAHDFYSQRPLVSHLLRWGRKRVAAVIAISKAVARDLRTVLPGTPVQVVYNAVDVKEFTPAAANGTRLDDLAGLTPGAPETVRVGLVGTYAKWKGQDIFLRAIARIVSGPLKQAVRFYVIGGPIYHTTGSQFSENELRSLARQLDIERHVGFIGFQERPAPIYQALDVVVHASTQPEPFGLTIVEAMACARPVIVSRAGGAAELFTHDYDAIGVPPGDAAALAAAMSVLVHDRERRQRLAENAVRTARERFDRDRLGPCILKLYKQICESAPGADDFSNGQEFNEAEKGMAP
jgi:glycosyltransferase involved in cell wall biosynthesis